MKPSTLYTSINIAVVAAALCLSSGCRKETRASTSPVKKPAARPTPPPVELPKITAPTVPDAARIVDLFYSANVGGDAEPCG